MAEQTMSIVKIFKEAKYTAQLMGKPEDADDFGQFCWMAWAESNYPKKFRFDYAWTHYFSKTYGSGTRLANYRASEAAKTAAHVDEIDLFDHRSRSIFDADPEEENDLPLSAITIELPNKIFKRCEVKLVEKTLFYRSPEWREYRETLEPLQVDWIKL